MVGLAPPEQSDDVSARLESGTPLESAPVLNAPLYDSRTGSSYDDDIDEQTHVYDDPLAALTRPRVASAEVETQTVDAAWDGQAREPQAAVAPQPQPRQPIVDAVWQSALETPVPSSVWEEAAAAVEPPIWARAADETPLAIAQPAEEPAPPSGESQLRVEPADAELLQAEDLVSLAHAPTLDSLATDVASRRSPRHSAPRSVRPSPQPENARYLEPRRPPETILPAPSEPGASGASVTLQGLAPDQAFTFPAGSVMYTEEPAPRALTASDAPWSEATVVRPLAKPRSKIWPLSLAFVASLGVTVVVLVLFLLPKEGSVLVTAAGPGGAPVAAARVFFDTKPICEQVPCWISGIHEGQHFVRVEAKGYVKTKDQAVVVRGGEDMPVAVQLAREAPPATAGIEIKSNVADLRVAIDGRDVGLAPLTVRGLEPAEHVVRLSSPLYAPYEQSLRLSADQLVTIEPQLKPVRTVLNLLPGRGGDIVLVQVSADGNAQRFRSLPVRLEVDPKKLYKITAIRKGYQDFRAEVVFSGKEAEKNLVIEMRKTGAGGVLEENISLAEEPVSGAPEAPAATTPGALNLFSTPVASVIVDGRPQGQTPRQVSVTPGAHSIVFVHPEFGRKTFSVNVAAGKSASITAKF